MMFNDGGKSDQQQTPVTNPICSPVYLMICAKVPHRESHIESDGLLRSGISLTSVRYVHFVFLGLIQMRGVRRAEAGNSAFVAQGGVSFLSSLLA